MTGNAASTPLRGGVCPRIPGIGGVRGALAARGYDGVSARWGGFNLLRCGAGLTELGLGDALAATGIPTAEHVDFDRHGNRIWGFASGLNIGYLACAGAADDPGEVRRLGGAVERGSRRVDDGCGAGGRVRRRSRRCGRRAGRADGLYSASGSTMSGCWSGVCCGAGAGGVQSDGGRCGVGANAALKLWPIRSRVGGGAGEALINWVAEVMMPDGRRARGLDPRRPGGGRASWFADGSRLAGRAGLITGTA